MFKSVIHAIIYIYMIMIVKFFLAQYIHCIYMIHNIMSIELFNKTAAVVYMHAKFMQNNPISPTK